MGLNFQYKISFLFFLKFHWRFLLNLILIVVLDIVSFKKEEK